MSAHHGFDRPVCRLDMHDSVADQPDSLGEKDFAKCLVQLAPIDMEGSKVDVEGRFAQPIAWDIVLLRPVPEFQHDVPLVSRDPVLNQIFHGQSEVFQQGRRRPVERFAHRISIQGIRLDAQNTQARIGEMNRCRHPSEAAANDGHIHLFCLGSHSVQGLVYLSPR